MLEDNQSHQRYPTRETVVDVVNLTMLIKIICKLAKKVAYITGRENLPSEEKVNICAVSRRARPMVVAMQNAMFGISLILTISQDMFPLLTGVYFCNQIYNSC